MSLHNRPTSVLDRNHKGPGYHDAAMADQMAHQTRHHQDQMAAMAAGTDEDFGKDTLDGYPKHLHSKDIVGDSLTVKSKEEEDAALSSGHWSADPLEIIKDDTGKVVGRVPEVVTDLPEAVKES